MVKRKDDNSAPPPGGRAAERLRQFEAARRPQTPEEATPDPSECDRQAEATQTPAKEDGKEPPEDTDGG
jgi:hypothetical protein